MASSIAHKEKPRLRLWSSAKVEYLIVCLEDYKSEMDDKNGDFFSDMIALFSCIRKRMAIKSVAELSNKWQELKRPNKRHAYGVYQNDSGQPVLCKADPGWKNMSEITPSPGSCKQEKRKTTGGELTRVGSQPGLV